MGRGIDDYRRKRDFEATPEPPAARPKKRAKKSAKQRAKRAAKAARPDVFVVHRHEARRLHYDLRLQMEGVLRSWAVPRGFSYDPADKHLAVRTEDHPLEYESFEGVIPKGQYGAGTMGIWDRGTYAVRGGADPAAAVAAGELKLVLRGRRLRGEWHMVRTKGGDEHWLLFKARDRYAAGDGLRAVDIDLSAAPDGALPRTLRPMEPGREVAPFSDPGFVFEMEFAGRRAFAAVAGGRVTWKGLGRAPRKGVLAEIEQELLLLRGETALVDGVLCALDDLGRPSRDAIDARLVGESGAADAPLYFYASDLLHFEGQDLRPLPLIERKLALRAVLPGGGSVLYVDHLPGNGEGLAEVASAAGLTTLLAKRAESAYRPGPSADWRRVTLRPKRGAARLSFDDALGRARLRGAKTRATFSNLEKVYWPKEGHTKGDLIAYYDRVAEHVLPYLHDRPVNMLRYPDGIEGESFYQHKVPAGAPGWLRTAVLSDSGKGEPERHVVCDDRDSLLYLINLGSIDLHPWMSRVDTPDRPDYLVLDLDPKDAPFGDVVRIARVLGRILRGIGLRPSLKTSGKTGLHVHVGLLPRYTYDQARMFGEGVARLVVRELPDIATVQRDVGRRGGRVYVDFGQNRRGQTIVPPYVIRPVPGARASAPLHWDELEGGLDLDQFNMLTMPARLDAVGDLFRPTLHDPQELEPAIEALGGYLRG